ncbi:MAG: 30S ribosomal protein S5 [Patescibacteria group bacterium]
MTDETNTKINEGDETIPPAEGVDVPVEAVAAVAAVVAEVSAPREEEAPRGRGRFSKNPRRASRSRPERVKPEFDSRIIDIRRVTRVVAGGRRFSFSVCVVAGNRRGSVGVGMGKAGDTALAVEKAYRTALKHRVTVPLTKDGTIAHEVKAKYSSGIVFIYPAIGRGVVAGGAVRDVLELAGMHNIGAKILSPSKNKLNIAQAAIKALSMARPAKENKRDTNTRMKTNDTN